MSRRRRSAIRRPAQCLSTRLTATASGCTAKVSNRIDEGGRHRYVKALDKSEDDIAIWPPPMPEPQLSKEEIEKEMEKIYGKDYRR